MYKMTLNDGTEVEFEGINGNNFIVPDQKEMNTSVFTDENLASVIVTDDDGYDHTFTNLSFTQQQKQKNGYYYVCFHEIPQQEVEMNEVKDLLIQIAEVEVNSGAIKIEDIKGSLQESVRGKMDDDKRLEL